jgi:hypothetical protein
VGSSSSFHPGDPPGKLAQGEQQRWLVADPPPPVHGFGELAQGLFARALLRLAGEPVQPPFYLRVLDVHRPAEILHVDVLVPELQVSHRSEVVHAGAVRAYRPARDLPLRRLVEVVEPGRHNETRGEPQQVPLPRSRQRLVEVVLVEHELALGRGIGTEVREVRVTAELNLEAGRRGGCEVRRHDPGRPSEEGERRDPHSGMALRHQPLKSRAVLFRDQLDRVASVRGRSPVSQR